MLHPHPKPGFQPGQPAARWNPALACLSLALVAALVGLPFLNTAPNRLMSGEAIYLFPLLLKGGQWTAFSGLAAVLAVLVALPFFRPGKQVFWSVILVATALVPGLLRLAADHAATLAPLQSPVARTSLGGAFWLAVALLGLLLADALQRLRAPAVVRVLVAMAVLVGVGALLGSGRCDELSIVKEYLNRAGGFLPLVLRHLEIVGLAMALTLCLGLPLGVAAFRQARVGKALLPVLNIAQTIPSIAMFGLLMAPLALLAASVPAVGRAGISGVGLAPAVLALTFYSLLPVVRGVLAGLGQLPSGVVDAARGMGMRASAIFWQVEAPLALPVVLAGVRTATVQAVGLAAVTALIGAGGLGSLMFEGLFSSAQDLVLLGVLPILALGLLADVVFSALIEMGRLPAVRSAAHD